MPNIKELNTFNTACDDFVSGKYILVDMKIASILSIIDKDEKLTNIVNSCQQNYDFNESAKQILKQNGGTYTLTLPLNEKEIISFVYNLLYKFKNGIVNFYDFLARYFNAEQVTNQEFEKFAVAVIAPFKDAVNTIYSKRHVIVEANEYQTNVYNKIMSTIKLVLKNLDAYKLNMNQKEEFTMLLNSLYLASEKNDKKLVYSLMIGLDYFTKCNKKAKIAYLSLQECFEKQD
jgi:hypothetical protein